MSRVMADMDNKSSHAQLLVNELNESLMNLASEKQQALQEINNTFLQLQERLKQRESTIKQNLMKAYDTKLLLIDEKLESFQGYLEYASEQRNNIHGKGNINNNNNNHVTLGFEIVDNEVVHKLSTEDLNLIANNIEKQYITKVKDVNEQILIPNIKLEMLTKKIFNTIKTLGFVEEAYDTSVVNKGGELEIKPTIVKVFNNGLNTDIRIDWTLFPSNVDKDIMMQRKTHISMVKVEWSEMQSSSKEKMSLYEVLNAISNTERKDVDEKFDPQQSALNKCSSYGVEESDKKRKLSSMFAPLQVQKPQSARKAIAAKTNQWNKKWSSKQVSFNGNKNDEYSGFTMNDNLLSSSSVMANILNDSCVINVRKYGKFFIRIRVILNTGFEIESESKFVEIFEKRVHVHTDDTWDTKTKDPVFKLGLFNKKVLQRSRSGTWKNCFGTQASKLGMVNIWYVKIKKKDSERKFFSTMFGIIKYARNNKLIDGCFAYGESQGENESLINDGFGFYTANGCLYHCNKYGQNHKYMAVVSLTTSEDTVAGSSVVNIISNSENGKKRKWRAPPPPPPMLARIKTGDVIKIILDYYESSLSFELIQDSSSAMSNLPQRETKVAFNIDSQMYYKLAISMRGCDEIQLMDSF